MTDKALFSPGAVVAPAIEWLNAHAHGVFNAISIAVEASLDLVESALLVLPAPAMAAAIVALVLWRQGLRMAVLAAGCLAVAGFSPDDLAITMEGRQLTIAGKREGASPDQAFLHRGIAARGFVRSFVLADGLEVEGARLEHGLLHVDLLRPENVEPVRRIPISIG